MGHELMNGRNCNGNIRMITGELAPYLKRKRDEGRQEASVITLRDGNEYESEMAKLFMEPKTKYVFRVCEICSQSSSFSLQLAPSCSCAPCERLIERKILMDLRGMTKARPFRLRGEM